MGKIRFPAGSWYMREVGIDRAVETRRRQRAPKARSPEADEQAVKYAHWLMARDGVDLDAMRAEAAAAVAPSIVKRRGRPSYDANADTRNLIAKARPSTKVIWEETQHGARPRFVQFFEFRGSYPLSQIHVTELPHWDAGWEVVEDLSDGPASLMELARAA